MRVALWFLREDMDGESVVDCEGAELLRQELYGARFRFSGVLNACHCAECDSAGLSILCFDFRFRVDTYFHVRILDLERSGRRDSNFA